MCIRDRAGTNKRIGMGRLSHRRRRWSGSLPITDVINALDNEQEALKKAGNTRDRPIVTKAPHDLRCPEQMDRFDPL